MYSDTMNGSILQKQAVYQTSFKKINWFGAFLSPFVRDTAMILLKQIVLIMLIYSVERERVETSSPVSSMHILLH